MDCLSHFLDMPQGHRLHIMEFPAKTKSGKEPLIFIHGAIEDGKIFYTKSGKGLAPFLREAGYSCYVLDMRARGLSSPPLSQAKNFNQHDILQDDLPAVIEYIRKHSGSDTFCFVSHSWGGVLVNSFLLKSPEWISRCTKNVHISTKRRVSVINLHRLFYIDLMWLIFGRLILFYKGYLPPKWYGPEGESKGTLMDSQKWVYSSLWKDKENGIDYNELSKAHQLPPTLYLTGAADKCLGHHKDVVRFALESQHDLKDVKLIGKRSGHRQDYDHINILTHPDAPHDHFSMVSRFLSQETV